MQSELIVALDVPTAADIGPVVDRLPDEVMFYKVGLELFVAEGPRALAPAPAPSSVEARLSASKAQPLPQNGRAGIKKDPLAA